ncbi:M14 family zinc carboxypeptidase [Hanstruepera marina]|uniref:M14 family zinc carboxypeptidase n=1 Tax=Hanstruepera marina TaxID=2873265 RepID=UPI001CA63710|nr:M14 family zinc carboxypeptidase [Hanstruepera marina]
MALHTLFSAYKNYKESQLFHRYIHNEMILPLLKNLPKNFDLNSIGKSVLDRPIYTVKIGHGNKRVLLWSQMHGNESTTTKAIFDVFNAIQSSDRACFDILNTCTLLFVPILNPDGAHAYTRVNANSVDLNRDAKALSQPESVVLRELFDEFKPHFCFNLHGQRTIFSAGNDDNVATLSFLSPAEETSRLVTDTRKKAMEVISLVNNYMQQVIPNQIGRYDDTYNENCVGDTFQSLNVPTILYEAGHFPNDYAREYTRELIYQSLMVALHNIATKEVSGNNYELYFDIPQNEKCFFDIIIRNAKVIENEHVVDLAFQYQEQLVDNTIIFKPILEKIEKLDDFFGHKEYNANGSLVSSPNSQEIKLGFANDFVLINNEKYSLLLSES